MKKIIKSDDDIQFLLSANKILETIQSQLKQEIEEGKIPGWKVRNQPFGFRWDETKLPDIEKLPGAVITKKEVLTFAQYRDTIGQPPEGLTVPYFRKKYEKEGNNSEQKTTTKKTSEKGKRKTR